MLRLFQPKTLSHALAKAAGGIINAFAPAQPQPQPILVAPSEKDQSIRFNRQSPRRARYRRASLAQPAGQMKSSWF